MLLSSPPVLIGGDGEGVGPGEALTLGVGLLPLNDCLDVEDSPELCFMRFSSGCTPSSSSASSSGVGVRLDMEMERGTGDVTVPSELRRLRLMDKSSGSALLLSCSSSVSAGGGVLTISMDF